MLTMLTMLTTLALSTGQGIVGTIILVLDIIAIVMVLKGNKSVGMKLLWILIIILLPLIGMILYFLLGRGGD